MIGKDIFGDRPPTAGLRRGRQRLRVPQDSIGRCKIELVNRTDMGVMTSVLAGMGYTDYQHTPLRSVSGSAKDAAGRHILFVVDCGVRVDCDGYPIVSMSPGRLSSMRKAESLWLCDNSATTVRCDYFALPDVSPGVPLDDGNYVPMSYVIGISSLSGDVFGEFSR